MLAISCLFALAASVSASGLIGGAPIYAPGHASVDYYSYPKYAFEYSVKDPHTGDNKAQWEKRDGDVVNGAYSLVEPDGSVRVVEYWADDKSGFHADVKKLGPNLHPVAAPVPIYKAPIPVLGHGAAIAPITVGPVASLGHLANAPLISGHVNGHLAPIAPIIKTPIIPIAKPIVPIVPSYHDSGLEGPNYYSGLPGPVYKSGPILSGYSGHQTITSHSLPVVKVPIEQPRYDYVVNYVKAPLGDGHYSVPSSGLEYVPDHGLTNQWGGPLESPYYVKPAYH